MRWDFTCPSCGRAEERDVPMEKRDAQRCSCGSRLTRRMAFAQQKVWVPFYMRSSHDETTYIPAEKEARQEFCEAAYRQHGRWRSDIAPGHKPTGDRASVATLVEAKREVPAEHAADSSGDVAMPEPDLKRLRRAEA